MRVHQRAGGGEIADGIDHHHSRVEVVDLPVHHREVHLETVLRRPGGMESKQALADPRLEVEADGSHVANELAEGFLEREVETPLAPPARRVHEVCGDTRLTRARRRGYEDA